MTIDLPSGVTNTWTAWSAEAGVTLSDYTELVKTGDGCLKIDVPIAFSGDIRVQQGALWPMVTGALGTAGGKVVVETGARLYYNTTDETVGTSPDFNGRAFHLAGTGPDGLGAVLCHCRADGSSRLLGTNITLTADTKIATAVGRLTFAYTITLDMGGHTLTLANVLNGRGLLMTNSGMKILNPGHIVADACQMLAEGTFNYGGSAANTLTFTNGAYLTFYDVSGTMNWTARFSPGTRLPMLVARYNNTADKVRNQYHGPMVLENHVMLSHGETNPGLVLAGKISGSGGFTTDDDTRRRDFTVSLTNPQNDLTGTSVFNAVTLKLPVSGALPATMAGVTFKGTRLVLQAAESNEVYQLPPAVFDGAGSVSYGVGTWAGTLVKKGAGTLAYHTQIGADTLDVQEGAVQFAHPAPGLHEGVHIDAANGVRTLYLDGLLVTNNVALQLNWAYRTSTKEGWQPRMLATYSGYIWNRSGETQTWTFAGSMFEGACLSLDGQKILETFVYNGGAWNGGNVHTVTVSPGAHLFTAAMYTTRNVTDTTWGGAFAAPTNEGWSWTNRFGLVVDRQGRNTPDWIYFEKIADPGDGTFLTRTTNAVYTAETGPVFGTMKFAQGTAIDLRGNTYAVPHLVGAPTVSSGSLLVQEDWTIPSEYLASTAEGPLASVPEGTLSFDDEANVVLNFPNGQPVGSLGRTWILAQAKNPINRVPALVCDVPGYRLSLQPLTPGTLRLRYDPGMTILVR